MAGAVDVVSHTEIERGRNGNTVLHSSYSVTSVTLCSWRTGGGWVGCIVGGWGRLESAPVSLWQSVTVAQRWIHKVASFHYPECIVTQKSTFLFQKTSEE